MLQAQFGHLLFNVQPQHLPFYKELFTFLGWAPRVDTPTMLGVGQAAGSLWFAASATATPNDYDGLGLNHLGLHVAQQSDVDQMVDYLRAHAIPPLFDTPRHRPEFSQDAAHTYYQVMFESPDRLLFEVVYIGPLAAAN